MPQGLHFSKALLRGLFAEERIFGGAYIQQEMYVTKSIGLAYSRKGNKKIICYRTVFAFFFLYLRAIPSISPRGLIFGGGI